jgi:Cof subfamily protein (haloacid dehalogenase superfamily)
MKLIFLDIDGTLTLPTGDISTLTKQAIVQARKNGHLVFLCTGRNKAAVTSLLHIGFDGMICSAGGYIEVQQNVIKEEYLSDTDVQEARQVFEYNHMIYNLEATDCTFLEDEMIKFLINPVLEKNQVNSEMNRLIQQEKEKFNVCSIKEYDQKPIPIHKLCFIAFHSQDIEQAKQALSYKYQFIVHDLFSEKTINGEIIKKGINKGKAIKQVLDYLHLDIQDTIGFGDSMNDLEMIQLCHIGVAMGNGSQELKKWADIVCETVQEDGVYHELKRQGLI